MRDVGARHRQIRELGGFFAIIFRAVSGAPLPPLEVTSSDR